MGKERFSSELAPNLVKTLSETLPFCYLAIKDLGRKGIRVTTSGYVRLTTIGAYCLLTGESPREMFRRGSLQACLAIWGWGMWVNDFFDRFDHLELHNSGSVNLTEKFKKAKIRKIGVGIPLVEEADLIVDNLPEGIKERAREAIQMTVENVAQVESNRPSLESSPTEEIFGYRFQVNEAYALPLITLLSFPDEHPPERVLRTLIPFMEAVCLVDDAVGVPEDLSKNLPTFATWALREAGDFNQATEYLETAASQKQSGRNGCLPSGWEFLKKFPETKELLRRTFFSFLSTTPDESIHKAFRAGTYILWKAYPPLYQSRLFQNFMGHNGAKGRQEFVA